MYWRISLKSYLGLLLASVNVQAHWIRISRSKIWRATCLTHAQGDSYEKILENQALTIALSLATIIK